LTGPEIAEAVHYLSRNTYYVRAASLQNGRKAFGHNLLNQPLMRNLLTDLCVESEAHTFNAMYMARAFDRYALFFWM
jgi:hypothetical protein